MQAVGAIGIKNIKLIFLELLFFDRECSILHQRKFGSNIGKNKEIAVSSTRG